MIRYTAIDLPELFLMQSALYLSSSLLFFPLTAEVFDRYSPYQQLNFHFGIKQQENTKCHIFSPLYPIYMYTCIYMTMCVCVEFVCLFVFFLHEFVNHFTICTPLHHIYIFNTKRCLKSTNHCCVYHTNEHVKHQQHSKKVRVSIRSTSFERGQNAMFRLIDTNRKIVH